MTSVETATYPKKAGAFKLGDLLMIANHPCKITVLNKSKTGKHGVCKCMFTAVGVFDKSKREMSKSSDKSVDAPTVERFELFLLGITQDGYLSLLDFNSGATRQDIKVPESKLGDHIRKLRNQGDGDNCLKISITKIGQQELITGAKIDES